MNSKTGWRVTQPSSENSEVSGKKIRTLFSNCSKVGLPGTWAWPTGLRLTSDGQGQIGH